MKILTNHLTILSAITLIVCHTEIFANNEEDSSFFRLKSIIDSSIRMNNGPGIQYVVIDKNSTLFEYAAGYSDFSTYQFMTLDNTLNAYSTTKLVTAIAILQLTERGIIQLDDKVSDYIPYIPYTTITIRQLLTHSSGVPNPVLGNFFIHWEDEHKTFNRDSLMNVVLRKNNKLKFKPGSKIGYSNLGYVLLGKVIEVSTNLSYEEYVQQNIFNRLNLDTNKCHFKSQGFSKSARPYYKTNNLSYNLLVCFIKGAISSKEGKWKTIENNWFTNFPAHGGLIVSAKEFAKIFQDLIADNPKLLNKQTVDLFFTEQLKYKNTRIAISWFIFNSGDKTMYSHRGGGVGYSTEVRYHRGSGIFTLLFINNTDQKSLSLMNKLDNEIIKNRNMKLNSTCGK